MKNLIYALVISLVFIGCKKTEVPEDVIPYLQEYTWKSAMSSTFSPYLDTINIETYNPTYPVGEDWHFDIALQTSYSSGTEVLFTTSSPDGYFYFGFLEEFTNGTHDTIYGSGYFDADTVYINYHFQSIESADKYGDVNIHSFNP